MGFEPAVIALTPPVITNENAGFLRYDANLAVVVVSDAGDQSPASTSYYLNRLRNVKGYQRANMFTFNVIGPFTQVAKPFSSTSSYLSIYNVGVPGADAYELANVITPPGTQINMQVQRGEQTINAAITLGKRVN